MFVLDVIVIISLKRVNMFNANNRSLIVDAKASATYTCPPENPDASDCSTKYSEVASSIGESWVGDTVTNAVNAFITSCSATKCRSGCPALASGINLGTELENYASDFEVCAPVAAVSTTPIADADCATPAANTDTCESKYQDVITATTTSQTSPWVAATVQAKINDFITACPITKCVPACRSVISAANVVNEYTSLKTKFTADCKLPSAAEPVSPDSGLINKNVCITLIIFAFAMLSIQL
jgi:hypothetical protein